MKGYKQLIVGIVVVVISFILNLGVFQSMQLDAPIFLKHYYEMPLEQYTSFEIHCVVNKEDERQLKGILFPEITGDKYYFRVTSTNRYEVTPYHEQRIYLINYTSSGDEKLIDEEIVLTEAIMLFNNGEEIKVPIGQIVFYPTLEDQKKVLDYTFSSASDSGEMSLNGVFVEDVTLLEIKSTLDPLVGDLMELQVNNSPPSKTTFEKGSQWELSGKFQIDNQDDRVFNCYDVQSRIYFQDTKGEILIDRVLNMRHLPYLNSRAVSILRKGE